MRVLVLRPEDGAGRTAERLAALGHKAICSPVLETVATDEPPPPGAFDGVIATSAHAFRLADRLALQRFVDLPLMCVGGRTSQGAREAGFLDIVAEAPDAARLARSLATDAHRGKHLIYIAGRERKPGLERALASAGIRTTPWVVYEARPAAALSEAASKALRKERLDAALHFSSRSASIFCDLVTAADLESEARALLHVAISTDAARGLDNLAPSRVRIAANPDEAGMLDQLR